MTEPRARRAGSAKTQLVARVAASLTEASKASAKLLALPRMTQHLDSRFTIHDSRHC
jgi:hypothetical protein